MPPSPNAVTDNAPPQDTAMLIIDMISDWQFEDADILLPAACAIAAPIQALKQRCVKAHIPVIYANDNRGRWRSDFQQRLRDAERSNEAAACIGRQLAPHEQDYLLLKPKHSAFLATPLHILLQDLQIRRLILTGVTTDQCVLVTATEARMHDFEVSCPRDCVATLNEARQQRTLAHMQEVLRIETVPSSQLRGCPSSDV